VSRVNKWYKTAIVLCYCGSQGFANNYCHHDPIIMPESCAKRFRKFFDTTEIKIRDFSPGGSEEMTYSYSVGPKNIAN
jgi:hypothetical protein